jgi:acyl-CoA thioesterase-2
VNSASKDRSLDFGSLLTLEPLGEDRFGARFEGEPEGGPTFGGDLLARAIMAATHTCEGKRLSSVHARFLRAVPAQRPLEFRVDRLTNGRRLAHRRVEIRSEERRLFELGACFTAGDEGVAYQEAAFPGDFPLPEALPSEEEYAHTAGWEDWEPWMMEWRWQGVPAAANEASTWLGWVRLAQPESLDAGQHAAALAYMSDVHSDWAVSRRVGGEHPRDRFISLDHALWIHRPLRWDDWLLVRSRSDVANGSRALTHREVFTRDGELLTTVAQEALLT